MKTEATKTRRTKRPLQVQADDRSLSHRAYQQIRDEILRGDLSIGDILSRRRLADRLNMSFLPVTEALQKLEAEGLVESKPRIGTRVRIPTEQDVLDSYVIREALESQAARLCAEHVTEKEKRQLRSSARRLDELQRLCQVDTVDSAFMFSVHTDHMRFHMRIAEFSRSPGLRNAIEKEQVLIFNWLYDVAARRQKLPRGFHSKLAIALCSGSAAKADSTMRAHVRYGLDQVLDWLASFNHGDKWRQKRGQS
jgi:DNA-binding GntR family transcriptional regulator